MAKNTTTITTIKTKAKQKTTKQKAKQTKTNKTKISWFLNWICCLQLPDTGSLYGFSDWGVFYHLLPCPHAGSHRELQKFLSLPSPHCDVIILGKAMKSSSSDSDPCKLLFTFLWVLLVLCFGLMFFPQVIQFLWTPAVIPFQMFKGSPSIMKLAQ